MLAGGWFLLPKAWRAARRLRPDINLLVVIAAIGASIIGEWVEASAVVFLFGVAEWLEGWADRRARRATEALLELAPKTRRRETRRTVCRSAGGSSRARRDHRDQIRHEHSA
jgi:Cd2+/Zn2+-exporting ATPase